MIHILLIIICINLYISFKHFKSIAAPPVLFCLGFLLCVLNSINYYKEWGLDKFHINTFVVLSIGISLFTFTAISVSKRKYQKMNVGTDNTSNIFIPTKALFIFALFFLLVLILVFRSLQQATGYTDFASVAYTVDSVNKFDDTESITLPFWVNSLYKIAYTSSCLLTYFGMKSFITNKKNSMNRFMYLVIFCMLIISPLFFGGRAGSVRYLWLMSFMFFYVYSERRNWKYHLPKKMVIVALSLAFLLAYSWTNLASFLGREVETQDNRYRTYTFAIYCGAQIKNLDLFLNEKSPKSNDKLVGYATFSQIYNKFIPKDKRENILPFRNYNGYGLGNVNTCFYNFIYDFGYWGLILTILCSLALTKLWYRVRYVNEKYKILLLCTYGILSYSVFTSFFSEGIISSVVSISFITQIFLWWVEYKIIMKLFSGRNNHKCAPIAKRI